ncbi:MAG: efflux RND transporter periplasmic adaptor subunit [Gemmatimonadota bacterium]|nr:efflux RND transporter periplasmic adaptor subunit [Gemmatimonadota bacterium]
MNDSPFGAPAPTGARRIVRSVAVVVLLAATAGGAWWLTRSPAAAVESMEGHQHGAAATADSARPVLLSAEQQRRIGVTFATATEGPLDQEIRAVAQLLPDETRLSLVTLRIDGWVEQLFVNQTGQAVRKGDPLFAVYSPMLVSAQEELLVARRLLDQLGDADAKARASALGLRDAARRRLAYWGVPEHLIAEIEASGTTRRTVTFEAPASGIVVEKMVLEGQRVMAGEPLYRLADLTTVWLEGDLFEQDLSQVRLGSMASAEIEAYPGESVQGRVIFVSPTVDPATRTARVRVALANRDLKLKPGMYGTIRFLAGGPAVVSVPRSAVLVTGERALVFVQAADGHLMPRQVELGRSSPERVAIRSGLLAGEVVVASATFLIDAESNLGAALGAMPGMDMGTPAPPPTAPPTKAMPGMAPDTGTATTPKGGADAHTSH